MNYDEADRQMTAEQLDDKYNPNGDGEHPHYTRTNWREEVSRGNTLLGYWCWVASEIEQDAE